MKVSLFISALFITFLTYSQSTIGNIDFEDGNFNNWTIINGTVLLPSGHGARPFLFSSFGAINGSNYNTASHFIINTQQNDPNVPLVKTLCPFTGSNSVRLGDLNGGAEATRIERIVSVNTTDTLLDFFFAIVMQDPAHPQHEQPYVFIEVYDSSQGALTLIDSIFILGGDSILIPDTNTSSYKYVDWSHKQFNLSQYSGQNILLRITNADCGYSSHSGRLYLDFSMNPKRRFLSLGLCFPGDIVSFRGSNYNSQGVFRDTTYTGMNIDSIFTLVLTESYQEPIGPSLASFDICSPPNYTINCNVVNPGKTSTQYNWVVNGVVVQSGLSSSINHTTSTVDTLYCEVTAYSSSCSITEYSDTVIVDPFISLPSVNLSLLGSDLLASVSGGIPRYYYSWKVNFSTLSVTDSILSPTLNGNYYVTITDANGCKTIDSLMGYSSGIDELTGDLNFNFYPNPATNSIYLQLNGEQGTIEILDAQGKLIQTNTVNRDGELNIEDLDKGAYLIRFISEEDKVIIKKLLVD